MTAPLHAPLHIPAILTVTLNPAIDHTVRLKELIPGTVHRALGSEWAAGGKGVNVAGCLADWRLDGEPSVVATGLLGEGNAPTFEAFFAAKGIADRFVRIPGHTRTNIKLLDEATGDTTDINPAGLMPQSVHLDQLRAVLEAEASAGSIVVLSGSLPPGLPHATYREIVRGLNREGARVILDAGGRAFRDALAAPADALPWAVKPNQYELEQWAGERFVDLGGMVRAAHRLCRQGIGLVVVSRGAEGALFVSERHVLLGRPPILQVASTVGAGDALVAGMVAALAEKAEPERVARMALSFAAAKLARRGPSLPDRAAVLSHFDTMTIERLTPPV